MAEEVIELSVEETNKLRASLGLAPLRVGNQSTPSSSQPTEPPPSTGSKPENGDQEVLEMSVDETNALRARLGLAPLRTGDSKASTKKEVIHKPAENTREEDIAKERIEQAKLKREAKLGAEQTFGSSTLSDNQKQSALSWADQMRKQASKKPKKPAASSSRKAEPTSYEEQELEGMHVSHNARDFEAGSTTVLTLADAPLLQTQHDGKAVGLNEDGVALENVSLMQSKKQEDGLRKKRLLEMGMGRAGGYAGFDDEEFEELGGTIGPSRQARSAFGGDDLDESGPSAVMGGFQIGRAGVSGEENISDFDKIQRGKAVSLIPTKADVAASDYMTLEEEEEEARARRKKDTKFKKKKKKDKKKRRKTKIDSDDEEEQPVGRSNGASTNILEQLEATAADDGEDSTHRKRRRVDSDDDAMNVDESLPTMTPSGQPSLKDKQSRYDKVMAKGNQQTDAAFAEPTRPKEVPKVEEEQDDMDDSFLNAALAKARRLNRLKAMNQSKGPKGADAVVAALQAKTSKPDEGSTKPGVISCAIDDTREFTLALAARAQQKEREAEKARQQKQSTSNTIVRKERDSKPEVETVSEEKPADDAEGESMEELAKQVKTDDLDSGLEGGTARSVGVGRGLSSFMSMLKTTGEVSGKNGKEELKGRAKDERNYENYQPLDLSKVVKIGSRATDKDKEMANREVKLEYRDKHGRLLTTKEAYREMCYQFHGHGASKKKEEKRLRQMEREQAQSRMASRQVASAQDGTTAGTLGALQATQKATGKAFLVHKT